MSGRNKKNYTWIVKRHIIEEFEVTAQTKVEVIFLVEDPCRITITKETIKKKKRTI